MSWKTLLTDRFNIDYPIIQAPMLGVSTPEMVAAVSNRGGLGSLPVGGLSAEVTRQLIRRTRGLTQRPFAVNLFVHEVPPYTEEDLEPMRRLLKEIAARKGYPLQDADLSGFRLHTYREQISVLLEEGISLVSFTFGCLDAHTIQQLKSNGCILTGTATCLAEALLLEKNGIDMISVQGIEAGGHRGTFLEDIPLPQIGLFSLLPQIAGAVQVPCIAAGGINSAASMKAAFELGAVGVQIGTAFIGTEESVAIPAYKARLHQMADHDTALTRSFSGRWARGLRNRLMEEIERSGIAIPPYPLQNSLTTALRKQAQLHDDSDYTNLWAGQSGRGTPGGRSAEVFDRLVREYELR